MLDDLLIKLKIKKAPVATEDKTEVTATGNKDAEEDSLEEEESEDAGSGGGDSDEDAAKKKKSMLIRGIVIAGLAYYGYTEFIDSPPPPPAIAKVRPKKPIKKEEPEKAAELKAEDDLKKAKEASSMNSSEKGPEEIKEVAKKETKSDPPLENITIIPKPPEMNSLPQPEPAIVDNEIDKKIDQLIDKEEKKETIVEQKTENKPKLSGEKKEEMTKPIVDMKDKIVVEENYLEPPPYDVLGRGLAYNCKEKYWACMSKATYLQCNKNMKWNKFNHKAAECAVVNVYQSEEDCMTVQKYNVATNQPTYFCE